MLRGLKVSYVVDKNFFVYQGRRLSAPATDDKVKLRVLVDHGSIELFANDGVAVATHFALPDPQNRSISFSGKKSATVSMVINELTSNWPEK